MRHPVNRKFFGVGVHMPPQPVHILTPESHSNAVYSTLSLSFLLHAGLRAMACSLDCSWKRFIVVRIGSFMLMFMFKVYGVIKSNLFCNLEVLTTALASCSFHGFRQFPQSGQLSNCLSLLNFLVLLLL